MANPEHVKLVRQGAEPIRQWQVQHLDIQLNLERADLALVNLVGPTWPAPTSTGQPYTEHT